MMEIPREVSGRPISRRGVHLHPNGLHDYWVTDDYWPKLWKRTGMSWVCMMSEGDNALLSGALRIALNAGVIPIVRLAYQFPDHFTQMETVNKMARLYEEYGAPLIVQFANEPFDPREWRIDVPSKDEAWSIITDRWNEAAYLIVENGGYPGFPDGPCYSENPFFRIGDPRGYWANRTACYLGHFYGKNRPLDWPYDDVSRYGTPLTKTEYEAALDDFWMDRDWMEVWVDGDPALTITLSLDRINALRAEWADPNLTAIEDPVCFRGWERVEAYSRVAFDGMMVNMAMTEGGWCPRDRAGSGDKIDYRWPYTTPKAVAQKTVQMYKDPSPMFAICPWLLADKFMAGGGDVGWAYDAWVTWAYYVLYGAEKPVIAALEADGGEPDLEAAAQWFDTANSLAQQSRAYLDTMIERLS